MDTEDNNFSEKAQENSTEKCRAFLANLLDVSKNEPKGVRSKVRKLTQGLINAEVEPEEYCTNLERMLNASPQSSLIPFLQNTLPMLRQALVSRVLVIEGIEAPASQAHVSTVACSSVQVADFTNMTPKKQQIESERLQKKPGPIRVYPGKVFKSKGGKKINIKRMDMPSCSFSADIPLDQSPDDKQPSSPSAAAHVLGNISGDDDDINDVVTMAGVDVAEESQQFTPSTNQTERILNSTDDSGLINLRAVEAKLKLSSERLGFSHYLPEVALYLKYGAESKIRDIVEKAIEVAVNRHAQSRMMRNGCVITSNVKVQLSFLRDVEEIQQKRAKAEAEAEAGTCAGSQDTEEDVMSESELENRQVEKDETAAQAIGERNRRENRQAQAPSASRSDESDAGGSNEAGPSTSAQADGDCNDGVVRVTIRDVIFVLEQDAYYRNSQFLCVLKMFKN
ncbi:PREDICTED: transcription initiation factor TFIID subunit 4-like [Papilio polytes]|uniref:transcription initiation factor TFIID subunit 4-like n=1 Tax=Papilio polytes TaxID=76194 RepID=UPI0006760BD6|nr:PREDICTED: transcription initiation factor TFIID subunit 4-like [Papilio polytes]